MTNGSPLFLLLFIGVVCGLAVWQVGIEIDQAWHRLLALLVAGTVGAGVLALTLGTPAALALAATVAVLFLLSLALTAQVDRGMERRRALRSSGSL